MRNAYIKNGFDEKILPVTQAKNIYDQNGVDLEAHLEIIYSEISKRDIKRIYREVSEITDAVRPSTYDILSDMDDNTIALLSVENDSYLVDEVNARAGGVLVLFKKTSVYFSSGMYFTYRYGELITGTSGLGGTSFVWSNSTRTIHSYHDGTPNTSTAVGVYQKIRSWGGLSVNPRLSQSDGTITIPKGVHKILVSAYVVVESVAEGDKFLHIFQNNAESKIMVKSNIKNNGTLCITPLILGVAEGDTIDLRFYSNSLDTLRSKHLTIEVIN